MRGSPFLKVKKPPPGVSVEIKETDQPCCIMWVDGETVGRASGPAVQGGGTIMKCMCSRGNGLETRIKGAGSQAVIVNTIYLD